MNLPLFTKSKLDNMTYYDIEYDEERISQRKKNKIFSLISKKNNKFILVLLINSKESTLDESIYILNEINNKFNKIKRKLNYELSSLYNNNANSVDINILTFKINVAIHSISFNNEVIKEITRIINCNN